MNNDWLPLGCVIVAIALAMKGNPGAALIALFIAVMAQ